MHVVVITGRPNHVAESGGVPQVHPLGWRMGGSSWPHCTSIIVCHTCRKAHLAPFLPTHPLVPPRGVAMDKSLGTVSAATWGSPLILPISWSYIKMMGADGLRKASQVSLEYCSND